MSGPWSWKGVRPRKGLRAVFSARLSPAEIDWPVVLLAFALISVSLVFVQTMSLADLHDGRDKVSFASHLKKLLVALPFLPLGMLLRPRWLRRSSWWVYGATIVLLLLVPVLGVERNNARRWIPLPVLGFDLQPSELVKLGVVLALARTLYRSRLAEWREWLPVAAVVLLPTALVAAQPDLGTALTLVPIALGMAWMAGARPGMITGLVLACGLCGVLAYQGELVKGYQMKRIETWAACLDDKVLIENKKGAAFHTYLARVSIGNGGFLGRGLGNGVANESGHLPERDCDSIFAVIAEEGGFVGAAVLIGAYVLFCAFLLIAAGRVRDRFSRLCAGGVALYFAAHFFINVSVNLGLLPMTGLPMPLVSTGGSSMMASFLALGLALGLSARQEPALDLDAFRG